MSTPNDELPTVLCTCSAVLVAATVTSAATPAKFEPTV